MFTEGKGRNLVVLLVFLTGLACGEEDDVTGACETGRSLSCVGPGGCEGYQVCDGFEWGPCECNPEDGGTDADADPPEADASTDADVPSEETAPDDVAPEDRIEDTVRDDGSEVPVCHPDDCYDGNPCATPSCIEGECVNVLFPDGTPCIGVIGRCYGGACCSGGCWTGTSCLPYATSGTSPTTCGADGRACVSCDDENECTENLCFAGRCDFNHYVPDGTPCSGGICRRGVCSS